MGKVGRVMAVVLAAVTGLVTLVSQAAVAVADPGAHESAFVAKLNDFRMARGLRPLSVRSDLAGVARSWSHKMHGRNDIAHNPNLASEAPQDWDRLGENVAVGLTVQDIHDAFVASAVHVRQMVDSGFDTVGVGVVPAGDGNMFVTVNFMTTRGAPAPAPAPAASAPAPAPAPAPDPAPQSAPPPPPPAPAPQAAAAEPAAPSAPAATRVCRRTRKGRVCTTRRAPRSAAVRKGRAVRRAPARRAPARRTTARRR